MCIYIYIYIKECAPNMENLEFKHGATSVPTVLILYACNPSQETPWVYRHSCAICTWHACLLLCLAKTSKCSKLGCKGNLRDMLKHKKKHIFRSDTLEFICHPASFAASQGQGIGDTFVIPAFHDWLVQPKLNYYFFSNTFNWARVAQHIRHIRHIP